MLFYRIQKIHNFERYALTDFVRQMDITSKEMLFSHFLVLNL
jgi:hypothetical protein